MCPVNQVLPTYSVPSIHQFIHVNTKLILYIILTNMIFTFHNNPPHILQNNLLTKTNISTGPCLPPC